MIVFHGAAEGQLEKAADAPQHPAGVVYQILVPDLQIVTAAGRLGAGGLDPLAPVRQARSRTRESVNRYGSAAYLTASTMPQTATVAYTTENIAISKRPRS